MDFVTIYSALVENGSVTVSREMWPRLAEFVRYCRKRGAELRGGFEDGNKIILFLK